MHYLSEDLEGTCAFIQVDSCDPLHLTGLHNVGTVRPDGQSHQVLTHRKLCTVTRSRQMLCSLLRNSKRQSGIIFNIWAP